MWHQLNGKGKGYVLTRNLLVFLFAVMNLHVTKEYVLLNSKTLPTIEANSAMKSSTGGAAGAADVDLSTSEKIADAMLRDEKSAVRDSGRLNTQTSTNS